MCATFLQHVLELVSNLMQQQSQFCIKCRHCNLRAINSLVPFPFHPSQILFILGIVEPCFLIVNIITSLPAVLMPSRSQCSQYDRAIYYLIVSGLGDWEMPSLPHFSFTMNHSWYKLFGVKCLKLNPYSSTKASLGVHNVPILFFAVAVVTRFINKAMWQSHLHYTS